MSRAAFFTGLILSSTLHFSLLRLSIPATQPHPTAQPAPVEAEMMEIPPDDPAPAEPDPEQTAPDEAEAPVAERTPDPPLPEASEPDPVQTTEAARREPAPVESTPEPTPTPQPDLARMAEETSSEIESRGDLAGRTEASDRAPSPELRIDWGDETTALTVMDAGGMKLAVLSVAGDGPNIVGEARRDERGWRRDRFRGDMRVRYSNRLRVVDEVPAFDAARRQVNLSSDEMLVVLVPTGVERMMESATLSAIFQRGLDMESVRRLGGRFTVEPSGLEFKVTRVQTRSAQ